MTGFGAAEGTVAGGRLRVEIRTVNHRHFNPALKLAQDLAPLEGELRERLRKDFDRGHIAVSARWTEAPAVLAPPIAVNLERARAAQAALRELKQTLGLPGEVDLGMIVRQPDVFVAAPAEAPEVPWSEVEPVVASAIASCKAML